MIHHLIRVSLDTEECAVADNQQPTSTTQLNIFGFLLRSVGQSIDWSILTVMLAYTWTDLSPTFVQTRDEVNSTSSQPLQPFPIRSILDEDDDYDDDSINDHTSEFEETHKEGDRTFTRTIRDDDSDNDDVDDDDLNDVTANVRKRHS